MRTSKVCWEPLRAGTGFGARPAIADEELFLVELHQALDGHAELVDVAAAIGAVGAPVGDRTAVAVEVDLHDLVPQLGIEGLRTRFEILLRALGQLRMQSRETLEVGLVDSHGDLHHCSVVDDLRPRRRLAVDVLANGVNQAAGKAEDCRHDNAHIIAHLSVGHDRDDAHADEDDASEDEWGPLALLHERKTDTAADVGADIQLQELTEEVKRSKNCSSDLKLHSLAANACSGIASPEARCNLREPRGRNAALGLLRLALLLSRHETLSARARKSRWCRGHERSRRLR